MSIPRARVSSRSDSGSSITESTRSLRPRSSTRPTFVPASGVVEPPNGLLQVAGRRLYAQLAFALEEDEHEPRMEDLPEAARDELQHPRELDLGRKRVPHLDQGLELIRPALGRLEQARVLDRHGRLGGEKRNELLVLGREVAPAFLLGQVEVPVRHAAQEDRHTEERPHRRVVQREPDRARVLRDVVEPQRLCVADEDAENPPSPRQVPDPRDRLRVQTRRDETLQFAPVGIDHAERRVARSRDLRGGLGEVLQEGVE